MNEPILTIVVPCYNEEEVLQETTKQLTYLLEDLETEKLIHTQSKIMFVDDGSKDRTWNMIEEESFVNGYVTGLKLSRNAGHQNALLAGLMKAKEFSDCVISIDADLQDDITVIREFILKYNEGCEIVYGVRRKRDTDTFLKRTTANGFYRFMQKIGIDLIPNHADFRLMSKRALDELCRYEENNLFLRGIIPLIGFKSANVYYDRKERMAGTTKYPLKKMLAFAVDGITSFSIAPIRFVTLIGLMSIILSVLLGGYTIVQEVLGRTESGWSSLMISIWFIGGLQLLGIGVIGEYIGKIFKEVKRRPKYSIEANLNLEDTARKREIFHESTVR
ncbi:glycosyltransferase family 2 protein [Fictibacillus sp. WQ 8-8]|uniref:glycosyltransferase family 2 protein n=1 Tax=Fictibacillus sp. WQ 8-8 TaxID=2938788 RepID=UPI0008EF70E6|nr:glycosyltransferase family 2 protein [Fictibacillus sp. WQ 8-8]MCQ6267709.1 glycosyltransferase family 2 protein [Fictibacillus sp. WQ 8-8]SFE32259.1 Glycosyltransferase involved in cell wall bisynthesis [Bacillus sp. OV194]